jgi:hypothetical protein
MSSSKIPIFSPTLKRQKPSITTTEIILIVVAILIVIVFGIILIVTSHSFTKRKELFLISFDDTADYITPSSGKTITDQATPYIEDIKKKLDIEGLASLSELTEASTASASWCERGMIDTDFVNVYYIYNKNTSSRTDESCIDVNVPDDGRFYKESITVSEGVAGFLVYAEKPKVGTKYTLGGKSFIVKVPWNGKKWSRY